MSEWRHVEEGHGTHECLRCGDEWLEFSDSRRDPSLICTTPTPDPSSPCGWRRWVAAECLRPADHECHDDRRAVIGGWHFHPPLPTRCTCGHPIERVER